MDETTLGGLVIIGTILLCIIVGIANVVSPSGPSHGVGDRPESSDAYQEPGY